ncbi:MAG: hypothetical protein RIB67_08965 [Miltoncostaeaceae bacterium]
MSATARLVLFGAGLLAAAAIGAGAGWAVPELRDGAGDGREHAPAPRPADDRGAHGAMYRAHVDLPRAGAVRTVAHTVRVGR